MHRQMVVTNDGESFRALVHCPHQKMSVDANTECGDCARLMSLEWDVARGGRVVCETNGLGTAQTLTEVRTADVAEAAIRRTVRDIVVDGSREIGSAPRTSVVVVASNLAIARVRELFAGKHGLRSVPVVDEAGKLLGILSRSDLALKEAEIDACTTAADLMPTCVHALPEDAPLSYAIALMASEDVSEVPIVTEEGVVVGTCHALDVLRWLAKEIGYVLEPRARQQTG